MIHEILPVGPLQCNCSIFGDEEKSEALVIDPGDDIPQIQQVLDRHNLNVAKIVFTHAHFDHIGRAAQLKESSGAPTFMHEAEVPIWQSVPQQMARYGEPADPPAIDEFIKEGDKIEFGGAEFQILFTPGHSPGSVSLYIPSENKIVGGDVLFQGSVGRTDLPGADHQTLLHSIKTHFLPLDDSVTVIPGHGPLTSIGQERGWNPFLQGL